MLIYQGGIQSEADYPYQGRRIFCRFYIEKVKVKLDDCRSFNLTSQEKVKQLLYHTGPIAIGKLNKHALQLEFDNEYSEP